MKGIRPLAVTDLDAMERLETLCFEEPWTPAALAQALGQQGEVALGAEDDQGRLCAFALGIVVLEEAELHTIGVDPAEQGKGRGRRLLKAFIAECVARGVRRLFLEVRLDNLAALALYRSEGFVPLRTLRDYYGPGRDGLSLVLPLDPAPAGAFS